MGSMLRVSVQTIFSISKLGEHLRHYKIQTQAAALSRRAVPPQEVTPLDCGRQCVFMFAAFARCDSLLTSTFICIKEL